MSRSSAASAAAGAKKSKAGPGSAKATAAGSKQMSGNTLRQAEEAMLMSGLTAFHTHHQSAYKGRWLTSLYPSLLLQHPSVACLNRHLGSRSLAQIREKLRNRGAKPWTRGNEGEAECWKYDDELPSSTNEGEADVSDAVSQLSVAPASTDFEEEADMRAVHSRFLPPSPLDPNVSQLLPYYLLDGASVLAVDALQVQPHHSVLDLCAAPGGKSIVITQCLDLLDQLPVTASTTATPTPSTASSSSSTPASSATLALTQPTSMLHANEPQASRRLRLQKVLSEYIPPTIRKNRTRVEVTGWDATKISLPVGRYDRVLVDAPCSSDRHVLQNAKELASWSVKRIKENADRQEILLFNALRSVKVGGIVVYATCSLSKAENDQVIANVLEKLAKNKMNQSASNSQSRVHVQVLKIQLHGTQPSQQQQQQQQDAAVANSGLANENDDILYLPMGEPTKYGWLVLPDQVMQTVPPLSSATDEPASATDSSSASSSAASDATSSASPKPAIGHGFGPLYFCRLKRISNVAAGEAPEDEDSEYSTSEEEHSDDEKQHKDASDEE